MKKTINIKIEWVKWSKLLWFCALLIAYNELPEWWEYIPFFFIVMWFLLLQKRLETKK